MKLPNEKAASQQNLTSGVSRKASKSIHGPALCRWRGLQKYLDLMPRMIWIQCQQEQSKASIKSKVRLRSRTVVKSGDVFNLGWPVPF